MHENCIVRTIRCIFLLLISFILADQLWGATGLVKQKDFRSLMITPKDVPWDVILKYMEYGPSAESIPPADADKRAYWFISHAHPDPLFAAAK